jgi:signal transduction histidine kinase
VLGQLTATVAHELRNPLSAIRNTLFSIKEIAAAGGVRIDRPVGRMERSIARCDRIIGDLLEYTRHRELSRKTVGFDRWVDDIVGDQHLAAGISIVRDLDARGASVAIDPDRMRRVLINLIDNAAQALGEIAAEGADKHIAVATRPVGDAVELTIADSGPGIAPENLARVFEPLFSTKSFGTGLGLATVKQIVRQHDGAITIDSEVGVGTRVTVRLPLAKPAEVAA